MTRAIRARDRYLDLDVSRHSGATILASSLAWENSKECREIENGVFAEGLISAFTREETDRNRDGYIDVQEIHLAASEAVTDLTHDEQHPNVERSNPLQDVRFAAPR